jgi:hypothetical protein
VFLVELIARKARKFLKARKQKTAEDNFFFSIDQWKWKLSLVMIRTQSQILKAKDLFFTYVSKLRARVVANLREKQQKEIKMIFKN